MDNFDYKEFSLKNLQSVLGEIIDQDDCNPEEIARSIIDACEANIVYHLKAVSKAAETIAKLKGLLKESNISEGTPSDWDDFWSSITPSK